MQYIQGKTITEVVGGEAKTTSIYRGKQAPVGKAHSRDIKECYNTMAIFGDDKKAVDIVGMNDMQQQAVQPENDSVHYAKKMGHFAKVCRSRTVSELQENTQDDTWEEQNSTNNDINDISFSVSALEKINEPNRSWWITFKLTGVGQNIKFKADTGAQINAVPEHVYNAWKNKPHLEPFQQTETNFDGGKVEV